MIRIGLCQLLVGDNKADNIARARLQLLRAADAGASMAILPEMFSIVYRAELFAPAADSLPDGDSFAMLSETAKETGMTIIGGSVPEYRDGRVYNTCACFAGDGSLLGTYSKAHLFDVDVPGKFRFFESEVIAPGDRLPLVLNNAPVKTGVGICFDIRFPEWGRFIMEAGADLYALPAAFACNTGPRHWELLLRARALDNQLFVAGVAPAHTPHSYGHSMLATPDGKVQHDCGEQEGVFVVPLDMGLLEEMRGSIPVKANRRTDLYQLTDRTIR